MKIAIIGNMNNMYFPLARYLADAGYDCDLLLLDNEPSHFHPSADTFQTTFNFTIKQLNWGDPAHFFSKKKQAEKDLSGYDVLIGSGTAPASVNRSGRRLDLFIPYGDDLYVWPFAPLVHPIRQLPYIALAWHQMRGIRRCPYLLFDRASSEFEKVFQRLNFQGKRIVSPPPLFYYREYEKDKEKFEKNHPYSDLLHQLRLDNDLLVLQHIRQFWRNYRDKWHMKGNDRLIKGFAQFVASHPGIKAKLLLFEYGEDVKRSKKLIEELGLQQQVLWFPKTLRKHLLYFIRMSDVVVGELYHSWNTYCVVHETLAMGKPLIHKRINAEMNDDYPELYPMLYADSAQTIYESLVRVINEKSQVAQIADGGQKWFLKYCVDEVLAHIKNIIEEKRTNV